MHNQTPGSPRTSRQTEPDCQPDLSTEMLVSWGMSPADAREWIESELPTIRDVVEKAANTDRGGLSPAAYADWVDRHGWTIEEAHDFLRAGFSQPEARFASNLIDHAATRRPHLTRDHLIEVWLTCPLSPAWICRALANGFTNPDTAHSLFVRSLTDPSLIKTLDICADFRGANNRDLHIDRKQLAAMGVQR